MKCGVHVADSTPAVGTYLGGYARMRNSNGRLDPLAATAVVFDGDGVAVLLALDLVFAHEDWVGRVREAVRQVLNRRDAVVTVACSHSHATPYATSGAPERRFQKYADGLIATCVRAVRAAWDDRVPATLHYATGATDIGINRRLPGPDGLVDFGWNEDGFYDSEVRVLAVRSASDQPIATVVNHGCHPICLPPWNRRISADWVGKMRGVVEAESGAPCLFVQGACADINPRHEWVPRRWGSNDIRGPHAADTDVGACEELGGRLGRAALDALAGDTETVEDGPIRGTDDTVDLQLVPEKLEGGAPLPYWRGMIRDKKLPKWLVDALLARAFPWHTAAHEERGLWSVPMAMQAVRIGGFALASHGSETFNRTGRAVIDASPTPHAFFGGYTNGMIGYVPTPDQIPLRGYEVDMVPYLYRLPGRFGPTAEPSARNRTIAMMNDLFGSI